MGMRLRMSTCALPEQSYGNKVMEECKYRRRLGNDKSLRDALGHSMETAPMYYSTFQGYLQSGRLFAQRLPGGDGVPESGHLGSLSEPKACA